MDIAEKGLSFQDARTKFLALLDSVNSKDVPAFVQWVSESFGTDSDNDEQSKKSKWIRDANKKILEIAEHLKLRLPLTAILDSENMMWPQTGYDSDCNSTNTLHVDSFLFDEDEVDRLVEEGKLSRNYCVKCGSKDTKQLNFISHSLSPAQIGFMFTHLVPLKKKKLSVLDIGSRLGAVVYGAALYGGSETKVTGVELNEDMVRLQKEMVKMYDMQNVEVVCADIRNQADLVKDADLIVMNNVFSFFMSHQDQLSCWEFLHDNMKKGCIIIHNPDIPSVVAHLPLTFKVEQWLQEKKVAGKVLEFCQVGDSVLYEDCSQLCMYRVI